MGYTNRSNVFKEVLAIGRVGALCGNVHVVNSPAWISDNALVLESFSEFDKQYLAHVLRSRNLNDISSKTAQPLVTGTQVQDQRVPLPSWDEQKSIVRFVDDLATRLDNLAAQARQGIALLTERRSALIAAAVTGKIDVRNLDKMAA